MELTNRASYGRGSCGCHTGTLIEGEGELMSISCNGLRRHSLKALLAVAMLAGAPAFLHAADAPAAAAAPAEAPAPAAEAPAVEPVNKGKVSLSLGVDFVTEYFFRGIAQENQGIIVQPYATVGFKVFEAEKGPINGVTLSIGTWNSFHSGPTGAEGVGKSSPDAWYESDFLANVSVNLFKDWTWGLGYTAYASPNDSYNTVQEVSTSISYNDAELLGKFAMTPTFMVAFETEDEADAGNSMFGAPGHTSSGIYAQLNLTPGFTVIESKDYPIGVKFPMTLGVSLDDYYEDGNPDNSDCGFGFFDVGIEFNVPLSFIPKDYGSWTFTAGPHFIWLGQNAQDLAKGVNGGNEFDVWGRFSITMAY